MSYLLDGVRDEQERCQKFADWSPSPYIISGVPPLRKVAGVTESNREFSFLLSCGKSSKRYVSDTETRIDEST